jgi:hypothetical protein
MKKLVIGCLGVLVLAGVGVAGVSYYLYRQVRSTVSQFAELGQIPEIERGVRLRGAFVPPSSEEVTPSQVDRFMRVQTQVRQHLGERFAELDQKYKTLSQKQNATIADAPSLIAAYRDVAAAWLDAKRTQVTALNDAGLSLEEYRWIRSQGYRALGVPYVDFDVGKMTEAIRAGRATEQSGQLLGAIGPSGPVRNRTLFEPFRKQLEDNMPLASFGL